MNLPTPFVPFSTTLLSLVLLLWLCRVADAQSVDSLEAVLHNTSGIAKAKAQLQLCDAYASKDWEKSVAYARQSVMLANSLHNDSLRFETNKALTKSYQGLGNYDSALVYGKIAIGLAFDTAGKASISQILGRVYESRSEYQQALAMDLQAIRLYQSLNNKKGYANTLNSLSFVYRATQQYQKALDVLNEAKALQEALSNKERLAGVIFNIGLITMEMGKCAEALPYFRKAMVGLTEDKEPMKFSSFYNNLANCYKKMMATNPVYYDSAIIYGKKNLKLKQQLNDYRGIANAHNNLAAAYEQGSEYNNEYNHATAALKISDSLHLKSIKKQALDYLITSEIALKKLSKLNSHFIAHKELMEELDKESYSNTLSEMAAKYETEKKEAENKQLVIANTQQSRLNWILATGSGLLLVMVIALLYFYRDKRKANVKLEQQKRQIQSNLQEKEALLREIHHRVKNNLQVISSLLNMQSYYLDDPRMINAIAEGQNRVKAMALIHQKLYQTDHLSEIDFQEYTEQLINHLATAMGHQYSRVHSTVNGSSLKLDIDTAIPLGLILNELITNAYKYAFSADKEGSFNVHLTRDEAAYYHLRISDSGQGLPADFNEENLNSLGLKLVRMLTEQLDGSLTISNEPGASFYIRFKESKLSA